MASVVDPLRDGLAGGHGARPTTGGARRAPWSVRCAGRPGNGELAYLFQGCCLIPSDDESSSV
jgi:hypothetical protein